MNMITNRACTFIYTAFNLSLPEHYFDLNPMRAEAIV